MRKKRLLQITRTCRSCSEDMHEVSLPRNQPCLGVLSWAASGASGGPLGTLPWLQPNNLRTFPLTYCYFGVQSVYPQHSAPSDTA